MDNERDKIWQIITKLNEHMTDLAKGVGDDYLIVLDKSQGRLALLEKGWTDAYSYDERTPDNFEWQESSGCTWAANMDNYIVIDPSEKW